MVVKDIAYEGVGWTDLLRIGAGGRLCEYTKQIFGFHKIQGNLLPVVRLLDSEEVLCFKELLKLL
jgi:hypothetical protein